MAEMKLIAPALKIVTYNRNPDFIGSQRESKVRRVSIFKSP